MYRIIKNTENQTCFPVTSVRSKRVFGCADNIIKDDQRHYLTPTHVEQLIILVDESQTYKFICNSFYKMLHFIHLYIALF